jgi:hypothetical protein
LIAQTDKIVSSHDSDSKAGTPTRPRARPFRLILRLIWSHLRLIGAGQDVGGAASHTVGLQQSSRSSSQHEARTLYGSREEHLFSFQQGFAMESLTKGGDLASLTDLMGHKSVETTKAFYAIFEQGDLRRKHDHFSAARWGS